MQIRSMQKVLTAIMAAFALSAGYHLSSQAADGDTEATPPFELKFTPVDEKDCRVVQPDTHDIKVGKGTLKFTAPTGTDCRFQQLPSSDPNGPEPMVTLKNQVVSVTFSSNGEWFSVPYDFQSKNQCFKYSFLIANGLGPSRFDDFICSVE